MTSILPELLLRPPPHQHHRPDRAQDQQRDEAHDGERYEQPGGHFDLALGLNFFLWIFIAHLFGWWGS